MKPGDLIRIRYAHAGPPDRVYIGIVVARGKRPGQLRVYFTQKPPVYYLEKDGLHYVSESPYIEILSSIDQRGAEA